MRKLFNPDEEEYDKFHANALKYKKFRRGKRLVSSDAVTEAFRLFNDKYGGSPNPEEV